MLSFRHLMTVSTTTAIALIYGASTTAQTSPPQQSQETLNPPTEKFPTTPSSKDVPLPENLNPNANPLFFPTQPQEVDIKTVQPVTLNQAIELAFKNNKDLQRTRLELERRQAEQEEARAALYPTIQTELEFDRVSSAGAQRQNLRSNLPPEFQNPEESTNLNGNFQLAYSIYSGGRREADLRRAAQEVRRSQLEIERIAEQTRFDTTDRYYRLQNADAQVAIAQASVEDRSQSLRDAQLLEQAGLGTRFDTLRAEADLATANQQLTQSISEQRKARRQLVELLSLGQQVELTAADEISEAGVWNLPLDDSIVLAYKNRAELEQLLLQRDISEQQREIALADIRPQVDFLANYNYGNNFDDNVVVTDGYSFAARVRWLFFDGGRAFARARQQNRNIDIADTEFARQRNAIRVQVEEAYFDLISNKDNIASTRINVERNEEALRLARLRFQAGVGTQTDVINAQRDLTDARSRFLQAIIGYNQSLNALQRGVSNLPDSRLFQLR